MCGRYALAGDWSEFTREFALEEVPEMPQRYNIAPCAGPGFEVPLIVAPGIMVPARFWYIPPFWTGPQNKLPTSFNARSETVATKPFFRGAQRCLIPTSGWREFPGPAGNKRAVQFERVTQEPATPLPFFAMAGIYSSFVDREKGVLMSSFAILTMEPSPAVAPYHDRMPLLVDADNYREWLDPQVPWAAAKRASAQSSRVARLRPYEASTYGNNTRATGPQCIAPAPVQPSLFDGGRA